MSDPLTPPSFPLHDAAREGQSLLARKLATDAPKSVLVKDQDGRTPLFWAASAGHSETFAVLLKALREDKSAFAKFDVDDVDEGGWTLLHIVASTGNEAILALLKPLDPDVAATTAGGQTPLHYAVSKGHIALARTLVTDLGASPRTRDKQGQTPLHRAAAVGSLPLAKLCIDNKAPLNTTDRTGWTPLHHAMAEGQGDVAVALVEAGADTEIKDQEGLTPLQVALDAKTESHVKAALAK